MLPELKQAGTNKWQIEEEDAKKMTAESGDAGSLGEAEREMRAQSATALTRAQNRLYVADTKYVRS